MRAVRIMLESTGEVDSAPPPARVWRGHTEDGVPVTAFITIAAGLSEDPKVNKRTMLALARRITSSAVITIPVKS